MVEICNSRGQCEVFHSDKNKVRKVFHCFSCSLGDASVKVHQILQLISSLGNLIGALSFAFTPNSPDLCLHALLYLKKAPVEAGCLTADHSGFPGSLFPSSQGILRYPTQCWWVDDMPAFLDILPKLLFSLDGPVFKLETAAGSLCWSENSPYHLDCDFAALRN